MAAVHAVRKWILILPLLLTVICVFLYFSGHKPGWNPRPNSDHHVTSLQFYEVASVRPPPLPKRFVLAFSYWEQMTQGVNNLLSLLRFARLWKAEVPVPFLDRTLLSGFPSYQGVTNFHYVADGDKTVDFDLGLLFKLDNFTGHPPKYSDYAPLIPYKEFVKELQNQFWIFYVNIIYNLDETHNHGQKRHCSIFNKYWNNPHFPGIRISCCEINGAIPTLPDDIATICGFKSFSSFVVIFKVWRGITHPDPNRHFRMFVPLDFLNNYTSLSPILPHSQYVIGNASEYTNQIIGSGVDYIGVHIRTEYLEINGNKGRLNDTKCILNAIKKANEVSLKYKINHILYFTDYTGLRNKGYVNLMASHGVKRSAYDPLLCHGIDNGAFIAQVEMKILSRATRLVVCGGGSFQKGVMKRFKERSSNPIVEIKGCA